MRRRIASVVAVVLATCIVAVSPASASGERIKVLVLGDSVASVLRWSPPTMRAFWKGPYDVTLEVWGCQKLVDPGCLEGGTPQPSALQLIAKHKDAGIDVVVVATGYNDTGAAYLRRSIQRINTAVTAMDARLMWLTYRENGNVRVKARDFNRVVMTQSKRLGFGVLDWAKVARKQKHWFTGDGVHMTAHGGVRLGNHVRRALDAFLAGQRVTPPPAP